MCEKTDELDALASLFRDVVLVLGGVFAVRGTDDETIERVARGLECSYLRARSAWRQNTPSRPKPRLTPHPAIAGLLRLARGEGDEDMNGKTRTPPCECPEEEFERLPGLFRRWEIEQVLEGGKDFHIEESGAACDGTPLFAVYRREEGHQGNIEQGDTR